MYNLSQAISYMKFKHRKFLTALRGGKVNADIPTIAHRLSKCGGGCPVMKNLRGTDRCGTGKKDEKGCGCPITKIVLEENYVCPNGEWEK